MGYILSFQEADIIQAPTPLPELIPYKGHWSTVFSICDSHGAERIKKGKENPSELPPEERHAYIGNGHRLVPLGVHCEGEYSKIANDGFIWCDTNQEESVAEYSNFASGVRYAMESCSCENYIVAIKLKYSNGIYVADNYKYEEKRKELFEAISPRERLTNAELDSAYAARGATIIPITEYKGDYKEPIVLIKRELDFDEIASVVRAEK